MHGAAFLQDLAVVMIVAATVTILCHRWKQPVVLGYILAGVIIGPHVLPAPLIKDQETIRTLAELGIVFLMFSLGLEFDLRKLTKVAVTALLCASLEILLMIWLGYEIGRGFGWKRMDCVFLGAMLSISSTTIIVKTLRELGLSKERFAELIYGILVVQDLLAIVIIALLSGIAMTGSLTAGQVLDTAARLVIFLVVAVVFGLLGVPRLIGYVGRFRSDEVLLVTVLGLCFGVALLALKLDYSVALGAFVIGAVLAEAREIGRIEHLTEPLRDTFSAVFFVAIGLMIDPALLSRQALSIVILTLAVVVGMTLTCAFGAFVAGNDPRTSLRVGMGLAQIGEFSFVIAALGQGLNVTSDFLYPIAVSVSALTAFLTPYLIKNSERGVAAFKQLASARFVSYMTLYTTWVGRWQESRHRSLAGRLIRRWTWQMALNLVLIAGIFVAASFIGERPPAWVGLIPLAVERIEAALWLGSVILALPMLIAIYRKLQALGLLLGEMAAARLTGQPRATGVQAVIANTVPIAGAVGLGLILLVLSAALLPSWKILFALLPVVGAVAALLWRSFVRIHARGQLALEETFAHPPPGRVEPPARLANLLRDARLEAVALTDDSPANHQLIRELALRTQTGASIVAIERAGTNLVNPGPDEELAAGDHLLLLGTLAQIEAARSYLVRTESGRGV